MRNGAGPCIASICLILVGAAMASAANEIVFVDPALHAAVLDALQLGEGQSIHAEDLETLTTLLAGAKGIADLTGLEAAAQLMHLHLHQNLLTDLEPLATLQALKSLSLNSNRIVNIDPLADSFSYRR